VARRELKGRVKIEGGTVAAAKPKIDGLPPTPIAGGSPSAKGGKGATNSRYTAPQPDPRARDHAEQDALGTLSDQIDETRGFDPALKGAPKPDVHGRVHMLVEQEVCAACTQGLDADAPPGVIRQFSDEYPNVRIIIANRRTPEVLVVENGTMARL
jgi:hypothetical protein